MLPWTTNFCNGPLPVQAPSIKYGSAVSPCFCKIQDLHSVMSIFCQCLHIRCSIIKFLGFFLYTTVALWVFMTLCLMWDQIPSMSWHYRMALPFAGRADTGVVNQRSHTFSKLPTQSYFLSESLNTSLLQVHRPESTCATVLQSSFLLRDSAVSHEGTAYNCSWKWCSANKSFAQTECLFSCCNHVFFHFKNHFIK